MHMCVHDHRRLLSKRNTFTSGLHENGLRKRPFPRKQKRIRKQQGKWKRWELCSAVLNFLRQAIVARASDCDLMTRIDSRLEISLHIWMRYIYIKIYLCRQQDPGLLWYFECDRLARPKINELESLALVYYYTAAIKRQAPGALCQNSLGSTFPTVPSGNRTVYPRPLPAATLVYLYALLLSIHMWMLYNLHCKLQSHVSKLQQDMVLTHTHVYTCI